MTARELFMEQNVNTNATFNPNTALAKITLNSSKLNNQSPISQIGIGENSQITGNVNIQQTGNILTQYVSNLQVQGTVNVQQQVTVDASKINFDLKSLLKSYYRNNEQYICRVISSLPKLDINENCFINLSIIKKIDQKKDDQKKLENKLCDYDRDRIYSSYEDIFNTNNKQFIPITDLFGFQHEISSKRLLIIGRAGIGYRVLSQILIFAAKRATRFLWAKFR